MQQIRTNLTRDANAIELQLKSLKRIDAATSNTDTPLRKVHC
jgi:hypothetical protein